MPTYNDAVVAPAFTFSTTKSRQTGRIYGRGPDFYYSNGGTASYGKSPGDVVAGLEGSPELPWNLLVATNVGDAFYTPIDDLIVPGSKLYNVVLNGEVDTGSLTFLCKLQSTPAEGTSDAWTDLATGSATVGSGGRSDMVFAPVASGSGLPVYAHGALYSTHYKYRAAFEVTAKSGSPGSLGLYGGFDLVWTETDVWKLLGGAVL